MVHDRPFRFGVTSSGVATGDEWRATARRAEALGYATILVSDHLGGQLAPFSTLATAAAATRDIGVGTMVLCNDFRHPVVQAMEIASLDIMSGGRVEWGIGAGWLPSDYERSGLEMDDRGVRVDRLIEAVPLLKRLLGPSSVHHDGDHYHVHDDEPGPRPIQQPHPPLTIGGAERRVLSLGAREADVISVAPSLRSRSMFGQPPRCTTVEAVDLQLEWIRSAAGARYGGVELSMTAFPANVVDDRDAHIAQISQSLGIPSDDVLASPHVLVGTVDEICHDLERCRARWDVSYWVVADVVMDRFAPVVERLSGH